MRSAAELHRPGGEAHRCAVDVVKIRSAQIGQITASEQEKFALVKPIRSQRASARRCRFRAVDL